MVFVRIVILSFICLFCWQNAYAGKIVNLAKINQSLSYHDDLHFDNMLQAIARQEQYFKKRDLSVKLKFAERKITRAHLEKSLLRFKALVKETLGCFDLYTKEICYVDFNRKMNQEFEAYQPIPGKNERGHEKGKTFFTAYYSPDLEGSFHKTDVYKYPIYAMPRDAKLQRLTSDEINFQGKLKNKGLEIVYVKDSLYDVWLLHVQGGGRVRVKLADGSYKKYYLSYKGSNKRKFNMLVTYMIRQGMLPKGSRSIEAQREYFNTHAALQREILASCPSFIFFELSSKEPMGVHNMQLTENRSLATDYRLMEEYGVINFIKTTKPIKVNGQIQRTNFSRFFLNQDTGGAIKGHARVDMYFGYGPQAELVAYNTAEYGDQYYLILK